MDEEKVWENILREQPTRLDLRYIIKRLKLLKEVSLVCPGKLERKKKTIISLIKEGPFPCKSPIEEAFVNIIESVSDIGELAISLETIRGKAWERLQKMELSEDDLRFIIEPVDVVEESAKEILRSRGKKIVKE